VNHLELYTERLRLPERTGRLATTRSPIARRRRALARSAVRAARHRARANRRTRSGHMGAGCHADIATTPRRPKDGPPPVGGRRAPACSRRRPRTPRSRSGSCASSRASRAGA
jgi:hypothetical protein